MAKEPVIQRYNIHVLTKTHRVEGESSTLFKFIELPKLKPCDDSNYCAHLYTNKVSVGLVETQTLVILGEDDQKNIAPISQLSEYYAGAITEGWKLFLFIDTMEQENLRFFTVNSETNEIVWTDRLLIDPMSDIITAQDKNDRNRCSKLDRSRRHESRRNNQSVLVSNRRRRKIQTILRKLRCARSNVLYGCIHG